MKLHYFTGRRLGLTPIVEEVQCDSSEKPDVIPSLKHIEYHSLDGFEWGYGGSGPADLALSLLVAVFIADAYEEKEAYEKAWPYHQAFKWEIIARLDDKEWMITANQVRAWVQKNDMQAEIGLAKKGVANGGS